MGGSSAIGANITTPMTSMIASAIEKLRSANSRVGNSGAFAVEKWITAIHAQLPASPA